MQTGGRVRHTETQRGKERERVLKADLTLGSVTTDQNPLKAIDHFHYSSHVSTLRNCLPDSKEFVWTNTHSHTCT